MGRDGQEIEEECGRRLAGVIDEVGGVEGGRDEEEGGKRREGLRGGGGWEDWDGKGERWVGGEGEEGMVGV